MPDEQVPMLEQIGPALLLSGGLLAALLLFAGPAPRLLGEFRCHVLAEFRQRVQDRLGDLLKDVHRANAIGTLRATIVIPFRSSTRRFIPHLSNRSWPDAE